MNKFKHYGTKPTSIDEFTEWLKNRERFTNSTGSFRGEPYDGHGIYQGWLANDQYRELKTAPNIDYLIRSYQTVMAWHDDNGWHQFQGSFSRTTTGHQSEISWALSALGKLGEPVQSAA